MFAIEVYNTKSGLWEHKDYIEDQDKAEKTYENLLSDSSAKTGLRLVNEQGNTSRLCHA